MNNRSHDERHANKERLATKRHAIIFAMAVSGLVAVAVCRAAEPIDIDSRRELFVDRALVERLEGEAEFRLHPPTRREVALKYDQPWEGNASGYATVIQDHGIYRMVYRGHRYLVKDKPLRQAQSEVV